MWNAPLPTLRDDAGESMKTEQRDGMQIDWDAPIGMDDGVVPVSYTHLTLPTIYSV